MTREQLEHAIRATCEVSEDTEIWIFGSQAILAEFPDAPEDLRASIEVDVQPKNRPENVDVIDGALGEFSLFHQTHGFYVHGLPIEEAVALPRGWQDRTKPIHDAISTRGKTGCFRRKCIQEQVRSRSPQRGYQEEDHSAEQVQEVSWQEAWDMEVHRDRGVQQEHHS